MAGKKAPAFSKKESRTRGMQKTPTPCEFVAKARSTKKEKNLWVLFQEKRRRGA